jgi:hypothetical protein
MSEEIPHNGKISPTMSVTDVIVLLSRGNPGAVNVMAMMVKRAGADVAAQANKFFLLLDLDDMNIRGDMIWIGFKDFADKNLDVFEAAIKARDPKLVAVINAERGPGRVDQAVTSGASFR